MKAKGFAYPCKVGLANSVQLGLASAVCLPFRIRWTLVQILTAQPPCVVLAAVPGQRPSLPGRASLQGKALALILSALRIIQEVVDLGYSGLPFLVPGNFFVSLGLSRIWSFLMSSAEACRKKGSLDTIPCLLDK